MLGMCNRWARNSRDATGVRKIAEAGGRSGSGDAGRIAGRDWRALGSAAIQRGHLAAPPSRAVTIAVILVETAVPRLVKAVTAAKVIRVPATAYSTIVRPSSSRRNAIRKFRMLICPIC